VSVEASVNSARVQILATEADVAELTRLATPFIEFAACQSTGSPAVLVLQSPPDGSDWRRIAVSSEYEPDRVLWVDDSRRRVAVVGEPSAWRSQQVLRSVRHLLRWQAYARGDLFLHGGLVRANHQGIVFIGHKRSGKTSSVLSMLLHGKADFVSNDDVVISDPSSILTGYGSPRSINIRTDSLLALAESVPSLARLIPESSHPTNAFPGRHRTAEAMTTSSGVTLAGSIWVRCAELSQATSCALVARHRVDAVVLPRFEDSPDGPSLTLLDRETASRSLLEHVEPSATKYDPFLADWFPDTAQARREHLLEQLVAKTRCYQLVQDMHRLPEATALVLGVLAATLPVTHHEPISRHQLAALQTGGTER
jgi:hypothetical protein